MEEFGVSSDFASDANAATYYRHVLHSTLLAGRHRLDRVEQHRLRAPRPGPVPAPRVRAELRAHRRPRHAEGDAQGDAGLRARPWTASTTPDCERADTDTALIVSSLPGHPVPVHLAGRHSRIARALHQGYIAARLADLPPRLTRETTASSPAPGSTSPRRSSSSSPPPPTALRTSRSDGASVYVSYSRGRRGLAPRPVLRADERAVRRQAPARRRPRRPDHRRRRRAHLHPRLRRPDPGHHARPSRSAATSTAAPTCRSPRPPPRSSRPTPTAARAAAPPGRPRAR